MLLQFEQSSKVVILIINVREVILVEFEIHLFFSVTLDLRS